MDALGVGLSGIFGADDQKRYSHAAYGRIGTMDAGSLTTQGAGWLAASERLADVVNEPLTE